MQAMGSALLRAGLAVALVVALAAEQLLRREAEPLYGGVYPGPFLREELLALAAQEHVMRADSDEHPAPPPALDQALVDEPLIALQDRERIDAAVGCDGAHRRQ